MKTEMQPQIHADERRERTNSVTEAIIKSAYEVSNELGCGFLEKVYENALAHSLSKRGHFAELQRPIDVWYDNVIVGHYVAI